MMPQTTAVFKT